MTPAPLPVVIDDALDAVPTRDALIADVRAGLTARPQKTLPPKWFYDDHGSELFDAITRLPEYYPTEREREILRDRSDQIVTASGADTVVELGSGTSDKTRTLLDAFSRAGRLTRFCPFDVSGAMLTLAAEAIAAAYPGVAVHGVVGDFERDLSRIPRGGTRLVLFLGGTIGNLDPEARAKFLTGVAGTLAPGDSLLLGTDLVKGTDRLIAAYDDSAGVTAAFNRNVLTVINRELGADFDLDAWAHEARWNEAEERIEMHLVARRAQTVSIPAADLEVEVVEGESIHTEISSKFRLDGVRRELAGAGFVPAAQWTDEGGDVALSLAHAPLTGVS